MGAAPEQSGPPIDAAQSRVLTAAGALVQPRAYLVPPELLELAATDGFAREVVGYLAPGYDVAITSAEATGDTQLLAKKISELDRMAAVVVEETERRKTSEL